MADSFMIRFSLHGKPCYANVYVYTTIPREYHVHIVNGHQYTGVPQSIVLVEGPDGLEAREARASLAGEIRHIIEEINKRNDGRE